MIEVSDPLFTKNISTLKETSVDTHEADHPQYMTMSQTSVINFDNVKNDYIKNLGLSDVPKSNDALYIDDENIIFIEFKNGYIDNEKQFALRKKIYDSVLIFTDIAGFGISKMRSTVDYILVINETHNTAEATKIKNYGQPSESFNKFAEMTGKLANEKYIPYRLQIFKNYCFRNVDVLTKSDFEVYLNNGFKHR